MLHLQGDGKKKNTLVNYRSAIVKYLAFLQSQKVTWATVTPKALDAWKVYLQQGRKLAIRSLNVDISAVRNFYRWARWSGYIVATPALDLRLVKPPKLLPKPISEEDVIKIIEGAEDPYYRAMLEVMYATGCRVGEVRGISIQDIDLERGTILTLGKGAQERYLELTSKAVEALKAHMGSLVDRRPEAPVWPARQNGGKHNPGRRIHLKTIRIHLRSIAASVGVKVDVWPHRIRHSFATHLLDHGADIRHVQEMLGHKYLVTTEIYTKVSRQAVRKTHRSCHPRN